MAQHTTGTASPAVVPAASLTARQGNPTLAWDDMNPPLPPAALFAVPAAAGRMPERMIAYPQAQSFATEPADTLAQRAAPPYAPYVEPADRQRVVAYAREREAQAAMLAHDPFYAFFRNVAGLLGLRIPDSGTSRLPADTAGIVPNAGQTPQGSRRRGVGASDPRAAGMEQLRAALARPEITGIIAPRPDIVAAVDLAHAQLLQTVRGLRGVPVEAFIVAPGVSAFFAKMVVAIANRMNFMSGASPMLVKTAQKHDIEIFECIAYFGRSVRYDHATQTLTDVNMPTEPYRGPGARPAAGSLVRI